MAKFPEVIMKDQCHFPETETKIFSGTETGISVPVQISAEPNFGRSLIIGASQHRSLFCDINDQQKQKIKGSF